MNDLRYSVFDVRMPDIKLKGVESLVQKSMGGEDLKKAFQEYLDISSKHLVEIPRDRDYHISYDFSGTEGPWKSFIGWRYDFEQDTQIDRFTNFMLPRGKYRRFVFGPTESLNVDTEKMFQIVFQNIGNDLKTDLLHYVFYRPNLTNNMNEMNAPINSVFAEMYVLLEKS